jgi:hypothetical protein
MFIIVENSSVVLGPMNWRPVMFSDCLLDEFEINYTLPLSNPNEDVININESIRILPVKNLGPNALFNQKIQQLSGPFYNFFETYAEMYYIPVDKPINIVKMELKQIVAAKRYEYEIAGVAATIQETEVKLYTDRESRSLYLQAYQLGSNTATWKFENGIWLTLSNTDLGQIVAAVSTHVQNVFDWESAKSTEIDSKLSLSDLNDIILTSETYENV